MHYLTFDLGVKVTRDVAQYHLHHVTYSTTKFEGATSNGLGGDTFTRNVTDGRRTGFDTKLIYPFFLKEKRGYKLCTTLLPIFIQSNLINLDKGSNSKDQDEMQHMVAFHQG